MVWSPIKGALQLNARSPTSVSSLQPTRRPHRWDGGDAAEARGEDFDLPVPREDASNSESLESISSLLFSERHLRAILDDRFLTHSFASFLKACRPESVSVLEYYQDARKALMAVGYANAIAKRLGSAQDKQRQAVHTSASNLDLETGMDEALKLLMKDGLPAYTAYLYTQAVKSRLRGPKHPSDASSQRPPSRPFTEAFCVTDPSRTDNPIVFSCRG